MFLKEVFEVPRSVRKLRQGLRLTDKATHFNRSSATACVSGKAELFLVATSPCPLPSGGNPTFDFRAKG